MKKVFSIILITKFLLLSPRLLAGELYESYISARAAGMGNAYSAVVKDDDSLFYNPAGLLRVEGINWKIFNLGLGANALQVNDSATDLTSDDQDTFAAAIQDLAGTRLWVMGKGKTALSFPGFGVAAYGNLNVGANVENPSFPNIKLNYTQDYGFVTGFAFPLIPGVATLGFNGKRIVRTGARFPIGMETLASLSSADLTDAIANRGVGYGVDMGLNLQLPLWGEPTVSVVWKNMGTTRFTLDAGSTRPPSIANEVVFGFGFNFETLLVDIRPALDIKHAFDYEERIGKKVHFGVEFDLPAFEVRGGFHQGYYTAGVGLDIALLRIDAATYGVELGEYPGQLEDRRYLLELSMEFGVDPDFGFLSGGGSSSGVKQRR